MFIHVIFLFVSSLAKEPTRFSVTSQSAEMEAVWVPQHWSGPIVAIELEESAFAATSK